MRGVAGSAGRGRLDTPEAEPGQIEFSDKGVDDANRVIRIDIILTTAGKNPSADGQHLQRNRPYGTSEAGPDHSIIRGSHTASGRKEPRKQFQLTHLS